MGRPPKFTKEQLEAALKRHDGDVLRAALELGVSPATIYRAVDRYQVEDRAPRERATA